MNTLGHIFFLFSHSNKILMKKNEYIHCESLINPIHYETGFFFHELVLTCIISII